MLNKVTLVGRLTRDLELKYLQTGMQVATFTLAIDRRFKNKNGQREADFIPIVVWGKQAEHCSNYIGKGSLVGVAGRIQTRNYDAADGTKRYVTEVVAEEVSFLGSSKKKENLNATQGNQNYGISSPGVSLDGFQPMDEEDDDLPF